MKYVSAICIYKKSTNQIYNLSVIDSNELNLNLIVYRTETGEPSPYKYNSFTDLYTAILKLLKYNNFKVKYTDENDGRLYNISFVNMESPEIRTDRMYYTGSYKF